VMTISFSTCNAFSVSGQRWRKSRIVIVFMGGEHHVSHLVQCNRWESFW
jgi:hypothetical protein